MRKCVKHERVWLWASKLSTVFKVTLWHGDPDFRDSACGTRSVTHVTKGNTPSQIVVKNVLKITWKSG